MGQFIIPHTPQQNGLVERKNRTSVECARSMLKGKGLYNSFWVEAINRDAYLKNTSATKHLEHKTPFEEFYGFKCKVSHLRILGCKEFSHVPQKDGRKLHSKAIKCIWLIIVQKKNHTKCMIQIHKGFCKQRCYIAWACRWKNGRGWT